MATGVKKEDTTVRLGMIIISDRAASGERPDETIPLVTSRFKKTDLIPAFSIIVPDEDNAIRKAIEQALVTDGLDLIITSGGTGLSARDITPEITGEFLEKTTPGIDEFLRAKGREQNLFSILSRGISGIARDRLVINMPGNPRAVVDNLAWLLPVIQHAIRVIRGPVTDREHRSE